MWNVFDISEASCAEVMSLTQDFATLSELQALVEQPKISRRPCLSSRFSSISSHRAEAHMEQALENEAMRLRQEAAREQAAKDRGSSSAQGLDISAALLEFSGSSQIRETHASFKKTNIRNIKERPETPRVEEVLPEDEEIQIAVLLIQRVLRGQAAQQRMYAGKEKRLDLINFLRASEQLKNIPCEAQEKLVFDETTAEAIDTLTASIQGHAIAETLDELAKEFRKVEDERRIAAMVALAERDRRLREAQESGTRQAEELLREREDEIFRRVMSLHHQTVDSYIENIIASSVDQVSKQQAIVEAKLRAEQLSRVVDDLEMKYQNPIMITRELVTSFLLPHVKMQQLQRQLLVEERRYTIAAHDVVKECFRPVNSTFGPII